MLFPWEVAGLGEDEARIVGDSANALLEFMVGQAQASIDQGDEYPRLFNESLNIFQRGMQSVARNSKTLTSIVTHNTRTALAKAMSNDLNRIQKSWESLPKSFRNDLSQSASATAQGILNIVRRDNIDMTSRARSTWYNVVSRYISQVNTGSMGYEEAVRRATLELADKGIRTVDYKSGVSSDVDVAVRRHVMTQIKQAGAMRTMALCEELGVELVEVSRSSNPRPSHARWEGQIYRIVDTRDDYPDFWEGTGYQGLRGPYTALGDQLDGVNCKHDFSPYEDYLDPMWDNNPYTEEELQERYDLTQEQRRLEREVRKAKRQAHLLEVAGQSNVQERAKVGNYQRQLRDLVSEHSDVLQRDYARERLNGFRDSSTGQEIKQPAPLGNGQMRKKTTNEEQKRKVINDALYYSQKNYVERHGGIVLRGGKEVEEHLASRNASASFIPGANGEPGVILLREDATTSDVLEEVYHFQQDERGDYNEIRDVVEIELRREIDAQKWLLSVGKRYNIPRSEQELTRQNLEKYERDLDEYLKAKNSQL